MQTTEQETRSTGEIEPEVMAPQTHLVRSPAVPTTLEDLAALDEGMEIIEAREKILETIRKASIRATNPQDWVLFKAVDPGGAERITGFLQDQGCKRVLPLWGIDIINLSGFEKTTDTVTGDFAYSIKGDGFCGFTKRSINDVEGLRYSTDRFLDNVTGIMKEMRVKQAARANLDGNITRKLTGLGSVAVEEIQEVWKGTWKTIDLCAKGQGYGTAKQRQGVDGKDAPKVPAPMCEAEKCGKTMRYFGASPDGKKPAAWLCPDYKWDSTAKTGNGHSRVMAAEYEKNLAASQKQNGQQEQGSGG